MQKSTTGFAQLLARYASRLEHLATRPQGVSLDAACAARMILLIGEGRSFKETAACFGVTPTRVETVRRRFMVHGIGGLIAPVRTANHPVLLLAQSEVPPRTSCPNQAA
ncbi:helix-turn-helix domain-containing protein [Verrucomicrobium spinosum]|uniref:helix-turn-helix domain-containing protein n=1 Tax=Verrucomicrobium spinosum TaxID=2736 RepID=UPI000174642A|nr:helix-turn-helix domain-containing protein [Verrucomicrobium spinosum]